ncbi:hypothetical protein GCM10010336_09600 [Streptomyces goshikiensis]|nr:hypothetical protein GCM10010336_09600 [Streptomyces goshikiensis]
MRAHRPNPLGGPGSEGVRPAFPIKDERAPEPISAPFVTGLTTGPPRLRFRIRPERHAPRSPHPRPTPPAHPPEPAPPPGRRGVHHTGTTIALLREAGTPAP